MRGPSWTTKTSSGTRDCDDDGGDEGNDDLCSGDSGGDAESEIVTIDDEDDFGDGGDNWALILRSMWTRDSDAKIHNP